MMSRDERLIGKKYKERKWKKRRKGERKDGRRGKKMKGKGNQKQMKRRERINK